MKAKLYCEEYQVARARLLAQNPTRCERCGRHTPFLQCHHLHYVSHGNMLLLCRECHWIADTIRKLGPSTLEVSAAENWCRLKNYMDELKPTPGWMQYGKWELIMIFYQQFVLLKTRCTAEDVASGLEIGVDKILH